MDKAANFFVNIARLFLQSNIVLYKLNISMIILYSIIMIIGEAGAINVTIIFIALFIFSNSMCVFISLIFSGAIRDIFLRKFERGKILEILSVIKKY